MSPSTENPLSQRWHLQQALTDGSMAAAENLCSKLNKEPPGYRDRSHGSQDRPGGSRDRLRGSQPLPGSVPQLPEVPGIGPAAPGGARDRPRSSRRFPGSVPRLPAVPRIGPAAPGGSRRPQPPGGPAAAPAGDSATCCPRGALQPRPGPWCEGRGLCETAGPQLIGTAAAFPVRGSWRKGKQE